MAAVEHEATAGLCKCRCGCDFMPDMTGNKYCFDCLSQMRVTVSTPDVATHGPWLEDTT